MLVRICNYSRKQAAFFTFFAPALQYISIEKSPISFPFRNTNPLQRHRCAWNCMAW